MVEMAILIVLFLYIGGGVFFSQEVDLRDRLGNAKAPEEDPLKQKKPEDLSKGELAQVLLPPPAKSPDGPADVVATRQKARFYVGYAPIALGHFISNGFSTGYFISTRWIMELGLSFPHPAFKVQSAHMNQNVTIYQLKIVGRYFFSNSANIYLGAARQYHSFVLGDKFIRLLPRESPEYAGSISIETFGPVLGISSQYYLAKNCLLQIDWLELYQPSINGSSRNVYSEVTRNSSPGESSDVNDFENKLKSQVYITGLRLSFVLAF